ncbi:hypothetical protein Cgig2_028892 [Carnegiea gigantea]|uniref:UBC core domain-containing protein n=1 Tax=Carnegiea gigantea TaxID=171969 RepID=A0A9Q1KNW9_9CARY|nr:hypothetical protein Cgig2_028892 [Carnegiea gigantea]
MLYVQLAVLMTMELFGDSDVESFSDTSSDDQDDAFAIYSGHAVSILSNLEDSMGKIDDFLSFERGFMHGDIVRYIRNPSGQMGRIMNVEMLVDLENIFGTVIKDIHSDRLLRVGSIMVGDHVVHGPWLGRVKKVVDKVSVLFDDGTKCEIMATDKSKLLPLSPNLLDDLLYPYHPGQRVKVLPARSLSSGWLCGVSKKNQNQGTVISVELGFVYVDWISSAMVGVGNTLPPPPSQQDPENLTLLSCFATANWQLGDWCILPKKLEIGRQRRFGSKLDEMFSIVKKKIWVDVLWQDGSCSAGLDSQSLFPVNVTSAHDFFPDQFVMEKASSDDRIVSTIRRWGVVRSVDADEQTVKVKWRSTTEHAKDLGDREVDETVSAYELVEHPDFSLNIGDIVFRSDTSTRTGCSACLSDNQKEYFLSCAGNVVGFKDGDIEVQWANGVTTEVAPDKILRVEKDDGSVATHILREENFTAFNDEMAQYKGQTANHEDLSDPAGSVSVEVRNNHRKSLFFSLSQGAVGLFTSIAADFFKARGATSPPQPTLWTHVLNVDTIQIFDGQGVLEPCDVSPGNPFMSVDELDTCRPVNSKQEIKASAEHAEFPALAEDTGSRHFRQFDVVADCSDHHFVDSLGKGMKKGWLKNVQQEWSILEKDLPETIYVRIYEERMDLIRAAIVGAPGTPYHNGLFFFDINLPPDYPYVPPHFEGLIQEHVERHSQHILSACKAYMEGAPIGFESMPEHGKGNSTGFRIMLEKLFPKLVDAFSNKGIDCRVDPFGSTFDARMGFFTASFYLLAM